MTAEILAVGTELLLGDIANTDAQMLSENLAVLGIDVLYHTVVGDNPTRLAEALNIARKRADIIITTGGLGPTYDDLTKQTICDVFGRKNVFHEDIAARLHERFASMGRTMTENNLQQAYLPENCTVFYNNNGTAPGILLRDGDRQAILLPGPPSELVPMFEQQVLPYLRTQCDSTLVSRWLHVIGIPESTLDVLLAEQLDAENPTTALYAKTGEVHIRITAKASDTDTAAAAAQRTADELCRILGSTV